jgi:SAM-dependent methyltransferase
VLDVCCGCGHVTRELVERGYHVTGLDASAALIAMAREALPKAAFIVSDARNFHLGTKFDGAMSTFDSLNHMLSYDDLRAVFRCVHASLRPNSPFFFDMNLEEAYSLDLSQWMRYATDDGIGFVHGTFSPQARRARTELIWFVQEGQENLWRRFDAAVEEQCYFPEEIRSALQESGFGEIEFYSAPEAGVTDDIGFGRIYVRAWAGNSGQRVDG